MRTHFKTRFEDRRGASALAVILGLFLTSGAAKALADEELREWSDAAGRHKLTARLQASSDGAVTLEMADGKLMEIEFTKLSENDRKYVNTHRANLKKPDDNPFKEKNAAKIEKLQAQLKEAREQIDEIWQAAKDNAHKLNNVERTLGAKIEDCRSEVADVARQVFYVNFRAVAAHLDLLLLGQQFSKVEVSCLEEQVRGAEQILKIADARYQNGRTSFADVLVVKAGLCMYRGCLAWAKGELKQCQKEYDDAVAACKEHAKIVNAQYRVGTVDYTTLFAAEAAAKDAELRASRVKERIAAREGQGKK
jgi:hypothetical protein